MAEGGSHFCIHEQGKEETEWETRIWEEKAYTKINTSPEITKILRNHHKTIIKSWMRIDW